MLGSLQLAPFVLTPYLFAWDTFCFFLAAAVCTAVGVLLFGGILQASCSAF